MHYPHIVARVNSERIIAVHNNGGAAVDRNDQIFKIRIIEVDLRIVRYDSELIQEGIYYHGLVSDP